MKNPGDVIFVMVTYLPTPGSIGEMKSKPTQNAVKQLDSYGVHANFIIARSSTPIDQKRKEKIAEFCSIPIENVISAPDIASIYDVPLNFERDKFGMQLSKALGLPKKKIQLQKWAGFVKSAKNASKEVKIAVVGKYFDSGDFVFSGHTSNPATIQHAIHTGLPPKSTPLSRNKAIKTSLPPKKTPRPSADSADAKLS